MHTLSDNSGSDGYGETSWETGDSPTTPTGKTKFFQKMIHKANTVPIIRIFKQSGVRLDPVHGMAICPFPSHKGGRENSASFKYYPETNSFYCFGCKVGGPQSHGCDFLANLEGINQSKAAFKILKVFSAYVDEEAAELEGQNFSERLEIMMDFSNAIREFRQTNLDEKANAFIECVCRVYDTANLKRKLSNEALRRLVDQLKEQIELYKKHVPHYNSW